MSRPGGLGTALPSLAAQERKERIELESRSQFTTLSAMKFFGAILAYLVIGAVLGWGILVAARGGSLWLLIAAVVVYVVAFGKIGCLPPSKSH